MTPSPARGAAPAERLEDARFLRGAGRYTADLAPPGALHVVFVRSPHAHAELRSLDSAAARAAPGVTAVLTGADAAAGGLSHLPAISEITGPDGQRHKEPERLVMAVTRVRHVGEIVAMVVADTADRARDAAELVEVAYEALPAVVAGDEALLPEAPQLHAEAPHNLMCHWLKGDEAAVRAGFARAARVVRLSQRFNRILANYLETRAVLASHDAASDVTTLTLGSQGSHIQQRVLCDRVLGWPRDRLRVVTPDVGGGFGPKLTVYPEAALLAWAARKLRVTLLWECGRVESFLSDNHARDLVAEMSLALDEEGRFLAVSVEAVANCGAYVSLLQPTIPTHGMAKVLSGLYRIPAMHLSMRCAFTNTVPVDAVRGAGKPETLALLERLVDVAASEGGWDPVELRRRNLVPREAFPYRTPFGSSYDSGDYEALLERAVGLADAAGFAARRERARRGGKRRGLGFSCHLHATGGFADEASVVAVNGDGTVDAFTGTQSQGQGHETVFAQVVSAALGISLDRVRLHQGDTSRIARGGGTGGSSSTIISATTLTLASRKVLEKGRELAADHLEAAPADVSYRDAAFEIAGTDRRIGLFELAGRTKLRETAELADRIETWPAGVMVCEVEVDPETGAVSVERLAAAIDVGAVLNPALLAGQVHGGIAMGVGQALLEDAVYDGRSGQLVASSWMDYGMPRADDLPFMAIDDVPVPTGNNALGLKGVGELPTNGAPAAVANAVLDALRPYGVRHLSSPLTPERVWRAMHGL